MPAVETSPRTRTWSVPDAVPGTLPGTAPTRTPRRRSLRELMRGFHRVLGLAAGLFLVSTGLTGSALVFRTEIDAALNPRLLRVEPAVQRASLQTILDEVVRRYPEEELPARVRMPRHAEGTYEIWMGLAPSLYVYADPYRDGAVLGARRPTEFLTGWIFLLHSHLLSGETGNLLAGIVALALILLSISGLVVWWPRGTPWGAWSRWRAALTVARTAGSARRTYDLHRAVGFYASAGLLLAGVTGASLVFHEAFQRAAYWVTGTQAPALTLPALSSEQRAHLPVDSLLQVARQTQPGGVVSYLYLPTAPGETFRVRQQLPGEEHPNGKSFVHVDPSTGQTLAVEDGARAPSGARLFSILYPLHIGILGGITTRVIALLVGLSLPLLAISGFLVWRRRGRR